MRRKKDASYLGPFSILDFPGMWVWWLNILFLLFLLVPFGSPYIFTKVVGFLVKFWRSCGRLNVLDAEIGGPAVYKSGINISIWATAHLPLP